MGMDNLQALFEHELKDIYYAEHKLVEGLQEMVGESSDDEVKAGFEQHLKETKGQIERLNKVFKAFGEAPEAEVCPGIEGLLKEKKQFTKEKPSEEILDLYNVTAAQKNERYEITAYESLILLAGQLGLNDAIPHLEANLREEEATLKKLQQLAKNFDFDSVGTEAA